jgi:hypothetical protein
MEGEVCRDDLSHWVTENVRADINPQVISHDSHRPLKPGEEIYFDFTFRHRALINLKLVRIDGEPELIYEETMNVSEGTHVH